MESPENPSQITAAGTTAARRAQDVQSRTRRFKIRQSDRVDLMCEMWSPEPEISLSRADLISCSYKNFDVTSAIKLARLLPVTHTVQRTSARLELMIHPYQLKWFPMVERVMYPSDAFGLRAGI